jgi:ElaB/YqjD/DUF883 family membrane-anchored ribosome-binding protein
MNTKTASLDNGGTASDQEAQSIRAAAAERVRRGVEAVRGHAQRLTGGARRASLGASDYVKKEPMKAMLVALAVGAAVGAVVSLMIRSREDG